MGVGAGAGRELRAEHTAREAGMRMLGMRDRERSDNRRQTGHEGRWLRRKRGKGTGKKRIIVACKAEVVSPCEGELEGKWASPYRNSRQSYCHGRVGAGIADGAASNLISGILEGTQTAGRG